MSKLIRITTEDTTGRFENDLNDGFTLEPNSRVALQSANFSRENASVSLDATNDNFRLTTDGGGNEVNLQVRDLHGFLSGPPHYDNTNYTQFQMNMAATINKSFDGTDANDVGLQCSVSTNNNHRTNINIVRTKFLDWNAAGAAGLLDDQLTFKNITRGTTLKMTASRDVSNTDAYGVDKNAFGQGGSVARMRVLKQVDRGPGAAGGADAAAYVIMGLIAEEHRDNISGNQIDLTNIHCGIKLPADLTAPIEIFSSDSNGNALGAVANVGGFTKNAVHQGGANNDGYTITKEDGRFVMRQFTSAVQAGRELRSNIVGTTNVCDPNKNYYLFYAIGHFDFDDVILDSCGGINDPFFKRPQSVRVALTNSVAHDPGIQNVGVIPDIPNTETAINIRFLTAGGAENTEIMEFLGYTSSNLNSKNVKSNNNNFIAENSSRAAMATETYNVQLLNLPLESYDSIGGGRESTLYTIVKDVLNNSEHEINFNSAYPIFIEIKNKNPILLRSLRARIVDSDLKPLNLLGRSQLTLIFA